tara:strand:- start:1017 stop:2834 length:1818 start_codon:yes stop_codon:yes gene_type:complete
MSRLTTANRRITCGKYDRQILLEHKPFRLNRLWSKNPNDDKKVDWVPVATDGKFIRCGNTVSNIKEFFNSNEEKNLIVLTNREAKFLLASALNSGSKISIFENAFPIFDNIHYTSDIDSNFQSLSYLLKKIAGWGFHSRSLAKSISNGFLYSIERKLRHKNSNDFFSALAYQPGYQEVFKFKEERADRQVLALDFNSMYASCMDGFFAEPKSLKKLSKEQLKFLDISNLPKGVYKALLRNPTTMFIKKYHPFKFTQLNRGIYFNLEDNDEVETLLFDNEIKFYARHFESIEIQTGYASNKSIPHPLYKSAKRIYKERLAFNRQGNIALANLCKFKLQCMHSSTNKRQIKKKVLPSVESLKNYLRKEYSILIPPDISVNQAIQHIQNSGSIEIRKVGKGFEVRSKNLDSTSTIYSLSSQILANSRIEMLKTLELVLAFDGIEICYANTDSIHLSVPKRDLSGFLADIQYLISDDLGRLKIQAISEQGYWFDIGRYWLANKNHLVYFKNSGFNSKGSLNPFTRVSQRTEITRGEFFNNARPYYVNINEEFSFNKRIENLTEKNINYRRYAFSEIEGIDRLLKTKEKETLASMPVKFKIFNEISSRIS